jgi:DNA polymerase-3 subunit delta
MASWDFRQLQQNLDSQNFPNLALIFGDEIFLLNEALKLIKKQVVDSSLLDFNYDQFFAGMDSASKVRDAVEQLPMMSNRRLVIYRDVEKLKDKDLEVLNPILDNPIESTCLILVSETVDKRKKIFKSCEKNGQTIELKKPYENQIAAWIDYIAYNHKLKLTKPGMEMLHQLVGSHLMDLKGEIQKLKQYLGDKNEASEEDILKVVSRLRVDSVFDLTEAIGKKDKVKALTVLANLMDHGQSEIGTLALIARHMRTLSSIQSGLEEGLRGAKLCAKVGVPSFFLQKYLYQSERWNKKQLAETMNALHETDKAIKSSPVSSHIWLENFILKTCQ